MRRACILVVLVVSVLRAQSTNASLTGRITDPSKALIADAKFAAINVATNFRYETTTSASGEYFLPNLPVGQQGNFGRNELRGFDATQTDAAGSSLYAALFERISHWERR